MPDYMIAIAALKFQRNLGKKLLTYFWCKICRLPTSVPDGKLLTSLSKGGIQKRATKLHGGLLDQSKSNRQLSPWSSVAGWTTSYFLRFPIHVIFFNIHAYTCIREGFIEARISNSVEDSKKGS